MTASATGVGQLVLRAALGGTLFAHGAQKLFGAFGGGGLDKTGGAFDSMGLHPGKPMALLAGLGEAVGGTALAAGVATPVAGATVAITMGVAAAQHASGGFFSTEGGLEYPALLAVAAATFALSGPGPYALDPLLGHALDRPWMRAVALGAIAPAIAAMVARQRAGQQRAAAAAGTEDAEFSI